MAKSAFLDCFSGISGDMVLGALLDLGLPLADLRRALSTLPVRGYEITAEKVLRSGISATHAKVVTHADNTESPSSHHTPHGHGEAQTHDHHDHHHDHDHGHGHHGHDHHHDHGHGHDHHHHHGPGGHTHTHDHPHAHHSGQPHRGFTEIRRLIQESDLPRAVKERATEAFHAIAVAEAEIHHSTVDEIHFHEIGAVDSIVDLVGAFWGFHELGIESVRCSPIAVGSGTVHVAHGAMPIPAPATARLLQGKPIYAGSATGEMTTPTGAAIVSVLATSYGSLDSFVIEQLGYGAGSRDYPHHPNVLRILLGTAPLVAPQNVAFGLPLIHERLFTISCDLDDITGEASGHALQHLMEYGALDVVLEPIQMKKGRPAVRLTVLCTEATIPQNLEFVFRHTTTLGVRVIPCDRFSLPRRVQEVDTPLGKVRVKVAYWGETILRATPEYEDCRRLAEENQLTLLQVYAAVAPHLPAAPSAA